MSKRYGISGGYTDGDLVQIVKPRNPRLHLRVGEVVGYRMGYVGVRVKDLDDGVPASTIYVHEKQLRGASAVDALAHALHHNQPCPCGSGRKYKQCHWSKAMPTDPRTDDPPGSQTGQMRLDSGRRTP